MLDSTTLKVDYGRMMELAGQGFHCSEILVSLGLEARGSSNPEVVRAVSGLAGGIGFCGDVCGALTGGACLLGLYAGRGTAGDTEDPRLRIMVSELFEWFAREQEARYGGIHCRDILQDDPRNIETRCPRVVAAVYKAVRTILEDNGFQWAGTAAPHAPEGATAACGACRSVAVGQ